MELLKTQTNMAGAGLTFDPVSPIYIRARPDSAKVVGAAKNRLA